MHYTSKALERGGHLAGTKILTGRSLCSLGMPDTFTTSFGVWPDACRGGVRVR